MSSVANVGAWRGPRAAGGKCLAGALLTLAVAAAVQAATVGRQEQRNGETYLVLENDVAKVAVWPEAGGAIVDFLDKRSGVDFSAKGVRKGATGYGWKETTALRPHEPMEQFASLPYKAELRQGKGYGAIVATCASGHLRVEREMRLADDSTALTVIVRHTNISDTPRTIWLRFHPYMSLDDGATMSAAILMPGPGPQSLRLKPFASVQDAHFMDIPGYWMALNSNGVGMWMTFAPENIMVGAAWNDASGGGKGKKPTNPGNVCPEIYPFPKRVAPGESVEVRCAYQPFVAADRTGQLGMDLVPGPHRAEARRFLELTRANVKAVVPYTMGGFGNYMHRRRERLALRDWGIVDAMMSVPGDQGVPIRTRLYAQAFEAYGKPFEVSYRLTITDALGKVVKQHLWRYAGTAESRVVDKREDLSIAELPDGRYEFALEAFEGAELKDPVHRFLDTCKLAGARRAAACEARVKAEQGVSLEQRERAFVKELRTMALPAADSGIVPIGVEEASGMARTGWPVRVGVPLASGALAKGASVALTGPGGKAVAAQTQVMGTWLDGSVKWLLVDFAADVPANGHVFYALKTNTPPTAALPALATQQGATVRVDTGAGKWSFSADDARVLGLFDAGDVWWQGADGRGYRFEVSGEESGISVVENGPMRAVVKVVGWYLPSAGAPGGPVARGEFRAEFCRGQGWFRLHHTFTFAGDPWKDALASTGVRFRGLLKNATEGGVDLDGALVMQPKALSLWQADEDHAVVESGAAALRTGRRSTGAAALRSATGRAVVYHRRLWEMFPKTVETDATAGTLAFEYWPKRAGPLDWRPREDGWHSSSPAPQWMGVGVSRTHEFIVDPTGALDPLLCRGAFDEPVVAAVPPRYLCATGALEQLQPYDPNKAPVVEGHIAEALDSYILNGEVYGWYGQWRYGTLPNWYFPDTKRWAYFGRYANLLNELDICHGPWLAYLRSGDRRYLAFAEANTRHLMEVGTIRLNPLFPEIVGMSRRHHECIWLGGGDTGHSMLDPFLELYHATGYRPGFEAAERMARGMAHSRGDSGRYLTNPIQGLARMYLETQEPFYKKEADRLWTDRAAASRGIIYGDHGSRMAMYYSQMNADCKAAVFAPGGWDIKIGTWSGLNYDLMAKVYAQTGDKRYAQQARASFGGTPADRPCTHVFQNYDTKRTDPLRWSIAMQPQHVLAELRPLLYATGMIDDAMKDKAGAALTPGGPTGLFAGAGGAETECCALPDAEEFFADFSDVALAPGAPSGREPAAAGPSGKRM